MKFALVLPGAYLAIALITWVDFSRAPPDGLANLGLAIVGLPATLLDLALRWLTGSRSPILIPDKLGYYQAHAVFFAIGVAITVVLLFLIGRAIDARAA